MLPLRYAFRWRIAGAALLAGVLVSTLMPALWLFPDISVRSLIEFDKWAHALAFTLLTVWFGGQYAASSWWRLAAALLVFGAAIEVCQYFTVHRTAEWQDLVADGVGIVTGLMISAAGTGGWSVRVEQRLLERGGAE